MLAKPDLDKESLDMLGIADYIEKHGWCQNDYEDEEGRVCILGALETLKNRNNPYISLSRFAKYVKTEYISEWNDAPGRTKEEVINTLREVAYSPPGE